MLIKFQNRRKNCNIFGIILIVKRLTLHFFDLVIYMENHILRAQID